MLTCVPLFSEEVRINAAIPLHVTGGVSRPFAYARFLPETLSVSRYVEGVLPAEMVNVKGGALRRAGRRSQRPTWGC
jgi:hypothetical protein